MELLEPLPIIFPDETRQDHGRFVHSRNSAATARPITDAAPRLTPLPAVVREAAPLDGVLVADEVVLVALPVVAVFSGTELDEEFPGVDAGVRVKLTLGALEMVVDGDVELTNGVVLITTSVDVDPVVTGDVMDVRSVELDDTEMGTGVDVVDAPDDTASADDELQPDVALAEGGQLSR